jgi:hypothetical protein
LRRDPAGIGLADTPLLKRRTAIDLDPATIDLNSASIAAQPLRDKDDAREE